MFETKLEDEFRGDCQWCGRGRLFVGVSARLNSTKRGDRWGLLEVRTYECSRCGNQIECRIWQANPAQLELF